MQTAVESRSGGSARTGVFDGVTGYHWVVVIIASCGWLFDCMDQRFFTVAKESALKELLGSDAAAQAALGKYLNIAVAAMMVGWGTGGIVFGMMSDEWGRVKTMMATLAVYSGFTGLSGFAHSWVEFTVYRFLVGLGVGGMFGAATTLVAESVPAGFRALALGSLQALSATGNMLGTLISLRIQPGADGVALVSWLHSTYSGWRVLFFVGILPAVLSVPILCFLREPEKWRAAKAAAAQGAGPVGSLQTKALDVREIQGPGRLAGVLRDAPTRAATHVQERLAAGVRARLGALRDTNAVPVEVVGELVAEMNRLIQGPSLYEAAAFEGVVLRKNTQNLLAKVARHPQPADVAFLNRQLLEQALPGALPSLQKHIDGVRSKGLLLQDAGSLLGMVSFTFVASFFNRRRAFLAAFVLCLFTSSFVFYSLKTETDAYWMLPMMGFAQLALFAGYSIYFPELYPTRLRGTGVGFCYNVVRFLTVPFNLAMGWLSTVLSFRTAAVILSGIYLLGMVTLVWAPETKDQPLPED
jgi:MFS family permease